jgi:hypothetical protein
VTIARVTNPLTGLIVSPPGHYHDRIRDGIGQEVIVSDSTDPGYAKLTFTGPSGSAFLETKSGGEFIFPQGLIRNETGNTTFVFTSQTTDIISPPQSRDAFKFSSTGSPTRSHTTWYYNSTELMRIGVTGNLVVSGQSHNFGSAGGSPAVMTSLTVDSGAFTVAWRFKPAGAYAALTTNRLFSVTNSTEAAEYFGVRGDGFVHAGVGFSLAAGQPVRWLETGGGADYTEIKAGNQTATAVYTLPLTPGVGVLYNNGSNQWAWGGLDDVPVSVDLAANSAGVATTFSRSDHKHDLSEAIVPTWSGVHTFSSESVHNGGIDMGVGVSDGFGLSGLFDSNVPDADLNMNFVFKPTTTMDPTSSSRFIYEIRNSSNAALMTIFGSGCVAFGGRSVVGGFVNYVGTVPAQGTGLGFNMIASFPFSTTLMQILNAICGSYLNPRPTSTSTATAWIGTCIEPGAFGGTTWQTITQAVYGVLYRKGINTGTTWTLTREAAFYVRGGITKASAHSVPLTTDMYGFLMDDYATLGSGANRTHTNIYGIRIEEQTGAVTNNVSAIFGQTNSGYKAVCFRDTSSWINSNAAAQLDLNSTTINANATTINMVAGGNTEWAVTANTSTLRDAHNIVVNATTGTKIATATTQKLGFWGATPIVRPSAFTQTYATATKTHAALTSATLTDNTAGTANTTVQALTDPVDAPATPDALRDDLVAVLIPELRNNFADLVAQVNALRVDLENAKQIANAIIDDGQAEGLLG